MAATSEIFIITFFRLAALVIQGASLKISSPTRPAVEHAPLDALAGLPKGNTLSQRLPG